MSHRGLVAVMLGLAALAAACTASTAPSASQPPASRAVSPASSPSAAAGRPSLFGAGTFVAQAKAGSFLVSRHPFAATRVQWHFPSRNAFGQQVSFLVVGARRGPNGPWIHIQLGVSPNESTAWAPRSEVKLTRVRDRVVVDLSQRTLRVYHDGALDKKFTVGVGQPQWPTTPGRYFIWAKVPQADPLGPYGVYALGLSGFSTVLTDWPGGGRMAIHGTANPGDRGQQVSHGCVRVYNPEMAQLESLPMGTPVTIQK